MGDTHFARKDMLPNHRWTVKTIRSSDWEGGMKVSVLGPALQ